MDGSASPNRVLFFFQSSGAHRDLHSFPTRRSSDLVDAPLDLAVNIAIEQIRPHDERQRKDRKSTRLNSSHRCISYAVFCLKKKSKERESIEEAKCWTFEHQAEVPHRQQNKGPTARR